MSLLKTPCARILDHRMRVGSLNAILAGAERLSIEERIATRTDRVTTTSGLASLLVAIAAVKVWNQLNVPTRRWRPTPYRKHRASLWSGTERRAKGAPVCFRMMWLRGHQKLSSSFSQSAGAFDHNRVWVSAKGKKRATSPTEQHRRGSVRRAVCDHITPHRSL